MRRGVKISLRVTRTLKKFQDQIWILEIFLQFHKEWKTTYFIGNESDEINCDEVQEVINWLETIVNHGLRLYKIGVKQRSIDKVYYQIQ